MWLAIIAPASALLGVAITLLVTWRNEGVRHNRDLEKERIKWEREQSVRHNNERLEAYANLLLAGNDLFDNTFIYRHDWEQMVMQGLPLTRPYQHMHQIVQMIASKPVRDAADVYKAAYKTLSDDIQAGNPPDDSDDPRITAFLDAAKAFQEAARRERDIT